MRGSTPFQTTGFGYSGVHWNSTILSGGRRALRPDVPVRRGDHAGTHRQLASGDAIGYHLGIDIVRKFRNAVGVGGVIRYSQAPIDLDGPDGSSVSVDAGGLTAAVDLRFRF